MGDTSLRTQCKCMHELPKFCTNKTWKLFTFPVPLHRPGLPVKCFPGVIKSTLGHIRAPIWNIRLTDDISTPSNVRHSVPWKNDCMCRFAQQFVTYAAPACCRDSLPPPLMLFRPENKAEKYYSEKTSTKKQEYCSFYKNLYRNNNDVVHKRETEKQYI